MGRKINTFSKAIKHLKSSKYDMLEAAPTNNTMGMMSKDVHGFETELQGDTRTYASPDFTQDDSADDTSGLFEADGTPKTALPPGDVSYILGPMSAMWYSWGNFTAIGYIKESDRRMQNLGTIQGPLGSWDQESNFTSYGQLTLEQAQWFYNVKKYNNADNDTPNYRAFYPGPPSNTPDEHGRYWCVITGEPKQTGGSGPVDGPQPPTPDSWDPGDIPPELAGYGLVGLLAALASFLGMSLNAAKEWWDNATPEERQRIMDLLNPPDVATVPSGPNSPLPAPGWTPRPGSNFRPGPMWNAPKPGGGSGTWGTTIKLAHHQPQGKVLSESRKSHILKNLKSPVVIPEEQKKFKVKPKIRGLKTVVSKPVETPKEYKKVGGRNLWGKAEYDYNTRQSQERKNETLALLGASDHHWEYMTETSKKKNAEEMAKFYGDHPDLYTYTFGGKKQKVLRKEQLKGDCLVFLVDENGVKTNMLQSKLNEKLAEQDEKRILDEYNKINPKPKRNDRISYEKDPLFKKVANRLKKEINYPDKPAKMGYPDTPPPEMVNDRHPDFGKRPGTSMFNRLDPQTAKAMPKQDDPIIDKKVEAAKKKPK